MEDIKENIEKQGKDPGDLTKMNFIIILSTLLSVLDSYHIKFHPYLCSDSWYLNFTKEKFP